MLKKKKTFIVLVSLIFVYFTFLKFDTRVANDFPFISRGMLKEGLRLPQLWSLRTAEGLGEYVVSTLWAWPVDFLYSLSGVSGLNFSVLERIFGVFPILLIGSYSIYKLFQYLKIKRWHVPAVFYLMNTYILLVIDGGQLAIGLAYAWFPLAFLGVTKAIDKGFKEKLLGGLAVSVLGFFDIRFVYVLFLLLSLKFLFDLVFERDRKFSGLVKGWVGAGFVAGAVFAGLHAYWLYPALKVQAPTLPATYQRVSQTSFLSFAELGHAFFLQQPHWFKNVFGRVSEVKPEFFLIPILVFLAPVLRKKSKTVGFWLLTAFVGTFLVKGANPPIPGAYPWLFENIPGFSLFRDPTKFFFLIALSYAVLIGITTEELTKRFNWSLDIGHWSFRVVPLLLIAYFLLLARPVWLGKMTGTFSEPIYKDEFFKVADILQEDEDFGRVFWIPTKAPLGYSSPAHPSVEASRLVQKRPFAIGTVGTYEQFNFLREAPFMGELFKIAGIDYIAYPFPDTRREELKQDNIDYYHAFLEQLRNLDWVYDVMIHHTPVALLKTTEDAEHFFIAENTFCVVGSDRIYNDLVEIEDFDLSKNALIFLEEQPGIGKKLESSECKYLLYKKDEVDLAAAFIDEGNFVFPAEQFDFDPDETGIWKRETADLIWWRNFLQTKYGIDNLDFDYGGGYSIAEGNREFQIPNSKFQIEGVLLTRVMESSKGGKVEFFQGEEKIGEIDTKIEEPQEVEITLTGNKDIPDQVFTYDKANFHWFEVGSLASDVPLTIKTSGDINVVNAIAVVPESEWQRINELIHEYSPVEWENLDKQEQTTLFTEVSVNDDVMIHHTRISPTHYKVKVEGLEEPVTLAFSETYDPLWELDGRSSYPLYSLINGFEIEEDGEYDIVFSAQRYVLPGLYISAATLVFVVGLLFYLRKVRS